MKQEPKLMNCLKQVIDPELGIHIVELGLVYGAELFETEEGEMAKVTMTLTTPGCPLGGYFIEQVTQVVVEGMDIEEDKVQVEIVWDPPWVPDMMTEESKAELGMD